jgi:hypothetical protein
MAWLAGSGMAGWLVGASGGAVGVFSGFSGSRVAVSASSGVGSSLATWLPIQAKPISKAAITRSKTEKLWVLCIKTLPRFPPVEGDNLFKNIIARNFYFIYIELTMSAF